MTNFISKYVIPILFGITAILIVIGIGFLVIGQSGAPAKSVSNVQNITAAEKNDISVRFAMEAYDTIIDKYWMATSSYSLPKIFQMSLAKASNTNPALTTSDRNGTAEMIAATISANPTLNKDNKLVLDTIQIVMYNLLPVGRDSLDSDKQQVALYQEVANVNPSVNLYSNLGVSASSSDKEIKIAYEKQAAKLANATSSADKQKAAEIAHAYKVLSDNNTRALYTNTGSEPAAANHIMGNTLYISLSKMANSVAQEFAWDVDRASTTPGLDSMIIDLRGNIGGSVDVGRGMAGLFLGNNQYAFDLFHQGDYLPQRTIFGKFDELKRYSEIAILVDAMTQSTAETLTQTLMHFNIAHSVGKTTRGWGTVENEYPLHTAIDPTVKYYLKIVNSLTLRDDGQPIESRGVTPNVDISSANWTKQLSSYFTSPSLITAVKSFTAKEPMR